MLEIMYLICSNKYYIKRLITNKVVKSLLQLNTTLFIDRDIYRYFTIAIYFAPCVALSVGSDSYTITTRIRPSGRK